MAKSKPTESKVCTAVLSNFRKLTVLDNIKKNGKFCVPRTVAYEQEHVAFGSNIEKF